MAKIGRNEPCPCGSGKKFKKCCGEKSEKVVHLSEWMLHDQIMDVKEAIEEFADREANNIAGAFYHSMLSNTYSLSELKGEDHWTAFIEWALFDYGWEDDLNLFQGFLQENRGWLRDSLIEELEKWSGSIFTLYEVEGVLPGKGMELYEIFTGEKKVLYLPGIEDLEEGEIVACRLLSAGDRYIILFGLFAIPPVAEEISIKEIEKARIRQSWESKYFKTWWEFFKHSGDLVLRLILDIQDYADDISSALDIEMKETIARIFLRTPRKELGNKSPLDLCYEDEGKEKMENFLDDIARGKFDEPPVRYSRYLEEIMSLVDIDLSPATIASNTWEKDSYLQEALFLLEKMKGEYFPRDIFITIGIWNRYSNEKKPVIRKKGAWAAAMEYVYSGMIMPDITQKELEEKYGVSVGTISRNSIKVEEYVQKQLTQEDDEEEAEPEIVTSNQMQKERFLFHIENTIADKNLESKEELDDLLNTINQEGLPRLDWDRVSPARRAQELVYDAWEEEDKEKRIKLAWAAIDIHGNCADAYVLLAEESTSLEIALDFYKKGVRAAEAEMGKEFMEECKGSFWNIIRTRPYMRARLGLAQCLHELGKVKEAIDHMYSLLELNPNDNQGVRYDLSSCLLEENRYEDLENLFTRFKDDDSAHMCYHLALFKFKAGEKLEARAALEKALQKNPIVSEYLLGWQELPRDIPPYFSAGSREEAVVYALAAKKIWERIPDALQWLKKEREKHN